MTEHVITGVEEVDGELVIYGLRSEAMRCTRDEVQRMVDALTEALGPPPAPEPPAGPGRCPFCNEEGERSTVRIADGSRVTLMPAEQFYDEAGRLHWHDRNKRSTGYWCSRGHRWAENVVTACHIDGCLAVIGGTEIVARHG